MNTGEEHAGQKEQQAQMPRGKGTHAVFEVQQTSSVSGAEGDRRHSHRGHWETDHVRLVGG